MPDSDKKPQGGWLENITGLLDAWGTTLFTLFRDGSWLRLILFLGLSGVAVVGGKDVIENFIIKDKDGTWKQNKQIVRREMLGAWLEIFLNVRDWSGEWLKKGWDYLHSPRSENAQVNRWIRQLNRSSNRWKRQTQRSLTQIRYLLLFLVFFMIGSVACIAWLYS